MQAKEEDVDPQEELRDTIEAIGFSPSLELNQVKIVYLFAV